MDRNRKLSTAPPSANSNAGVRHWHAGFNRPGYLPESEPGVYSTFEAARDALAEDMHVHVDNEETWADEHDCDDIACPTYGDECHWQRAQNLRAEREDALATDGPCWEGSGCGYAYWVNECHMQECVEEVVARVAAEWHEGRGSPLYVFASTGAIVAMANAEADECRQAADASDQSDVELLCAYISAVGERGPVDGWPRPPLLDDELKA